MTHTPTPCQSGDSDDWFINKRGLQYRPEGDVFDDINDDDVKDALGRRRRAKDACFIECPVRTQCLQVALEVRPEHGTWGGYYEEELRKILAEQDRRQRRRATIPLFSD